MFEWKVEEMKLMVSDAKYGYRTKIYHVEDELTREEKIQFVDSLHDGKLSYLLNIVEKYKEEKDTLSKNKYGTVNTNSLKAWIRKNDPLGLIDKEYSHGKIYYTHRYISNLNFKHSYEAYEDFVDQVFHEQLRYCEKLERKYWEEHDEYSILKKEFKNKKHCINFGIPISMWSSGKICVGDEYNEEQEITIEELKYLLSKYEELDKIIEEMTKEVKENFYKLGGK